MPNQTLTRILRWTLILLLPFLLATAVVRGLIAWDYPSFEYPRIPPDSFGFTFEERLELARATLDYLQRPEPADEVIYLLEELRLPGTSDPLYNEREIQHMVDVKVVADVFRNVMWVLLVVVGAAAVGLLLRPETRLDLVRGLAGGGVFTLLLTLAIGLLMAVAWEFVFTQFHNLFFEPGTWVFYYSDSLIRLFPERFWLDFGIIWLGTVLLIALLLAVGGGWIVRRSSVSR